MTKTYAQLTREIQALQAHAEKLRHSETKDVIAKLNASIAQYGLTAQDLHFPGGSASSSSSSTRSTHSGASPRAVTSADGVKYSDGPARVWGGRGPRPAWLREAMAQGRSLESFAATRKATRGAASAPTPAKVSLPPMYSHPKTGQTWSGRGPKPAWLKQSLKKRGASIEDFLISAPASAPASSSTGAGQTPAPAQVVPASRKGDGNNEATAKIGASGKTARKSLAEKVAKRTQPAPAASTQAATAAPAKKAAAAKSQRASTAGTSSKAPQGQKAPKAASTATTAKPATAPEASDASSTQTPAGPAASVKKSSSKANAKGATSSKGSKNAKPAAKKAAPARKNLPASIAPSSEPAPVPPAAPEAPLPGSESASESASNVDEGQTTESGN